MSLVHWYADGSFKIELNEEALAMLPDPTALIDAEGELSLGGMRLRLFVTRLDWTGGFEPGALTIEGRVRGTKEEGR